MPSIGQECLEMNSSGGKGVEIDVGSIGNLISSLTINGKYDDDDHDDDERR